MALNSRFSGPQAAARPPVGDPGLVWTPPKMSCQNRGDLVGNSYARPRAAAWPWRSREERTRSNEGFHRTTFRESIRLSRQKVRLGNFFLQCRSKTALGRGNFFLQSQKIELPTRRSPRPGVWEGKKVFEKIKKIDFTKSFFFAARAPAQRSKLES
jgi:hypothetical protein